MIIGQGLLAKAFTRFKHDPSVTIFASGVSNSQETRAAAFERERALLDDAFRLPGRLVYFSSCGVASEDGALTPYMRHKRAMERAVQARPGNLVLRLPQVVGRTDNPHTLTNFLRDKILSGTPFTVWARAERNLVDVDDVAAIAVDLMERKDEPLPPILAIAAERSLLMPELVSTFERVLRARANYDVVDTGHALRIEHRLPDARNRALGIDLGEGYAERILDKYYGARAALA